MSPVELIVEGPLDEAVLERILRESGLQAGRTHIKRGRGGIEARLGSYNAAASKQMPFVVLMDLDRDPCAPTLRSRLLANHRRYLCLNIAVREVEAWLLADRERAAKFLHVSPALMPDRVESDEDPKRTLVQLAARSARREIREDLVPRSGSGRAVGPGYSSRLTEFVRDERRGWRPDVAAGRSDSLSRCLRRLQRMRNSA